MFKEAKSPLPWLIPPSRGVPLRSRNTTTAATVPAYLQYYRGPVVSNVEVVVVIWGNTDGDVQDGIGNFYQALVESSLMDELSEYSTVGQYKGTYVITPSAANNPDTITDADIVNELSAQIQAGVLPPPSSDAQKNVNTAYMVYFPVYKVISSSGGGGTSCVDFCAYHANSTVLYDKEYLELYYGVFPSFSNAGCNYGCGAASSAFDNMTALSTHELSELVTDPQVASAVTLGPPIGWVDIITFKFQEVADLCEPAEGPGPSGYTLALIWSNMQQNCVTAPAQFTVSAPSSAAPGAPVQMTLSIADSSGSTMTKYLGTVTFHSSDPLAILPSDYAFVGLDAGVHTFTVTPNTPGVQSFTVNDTSAQGVQGSASIDVVVPVTITVSAFPPGGVLSVDGQAFSSKATFQWSPGSSHSLAISAQQSANGSAYVFDHWSDGGGASHTITTPASNSIYTAYFNVGLERIGRPPRSASAASSKARLASKRKFSGPAGNLR